MSKCCRVYNSGGSVVVDLGASLHRPIVMEGNMVIDQYYGKTQLPLFSANACGTCPHTMQCPLWGVHFCIFPGDTQYIFSVQDHHIPISSWLSWQKSQIFLQLAVFFPSHFYTSSYISMHWPFPLLDLTPFYQRSIHAFSPLQMQLPVVVQARCLPCQ